MVRYNPKTLLALGLNVDNQPLAPMKKQAGQRNWTDERKRHLESIREVENESLRYKDLQGKACLHSTLKQSEVWF